MWATSTCKARAGRGASLLWLGTSAPQWGMCFGCDTAFDELATVGAFGVPEVVAGAEATEIVEVVRSTFPMWMDVIYVKTCALRTTHSINGELALVVRPLEDLLSTFGWDVPRVNGRGRRMIVL